MTRFATICANKLQIMKQRFSFSLANYPCNDYVHPISACIHSPSDPFAYIIHFVFVFSEANLKNKLQDVLVKKRPSFFIGRIPNSSLNGHDWYISTLFPACQ